MLATPALLKLACERKKKSLGYHAMFYVQASHEEQDGDEDLLSSGQLKFPKGRNRYRAEHKVGGDVDGRGSVKEVSECVALVILDGEIPSGLNRGALEDGGGDRSDEQPYGYYPGRVQDVLHGACRREDVDVRRDDRELRKGYGQGVEHVADEEELIESEVSD